MAEGLTFEPYRRRPRPPVYSPLTRDWRRWLLASSAFPLAFATTIAIYLALQDTGLWARPWTQNLFLAVGPVSGVFWGLLTKPFTRKSAREQVEWDLRWQAWERADANWRRSLS